MTLKENVGLIYYLATGKIVKSARLPKGERFVDHYSLRQGQAFLVGERVDNLDEYKVIAGKVAPKEKPPRPLDKVKFAALNEIDRRSGVIKAEIIPDGSGHEFTYLKKETQARSYLKDMSSNRLDKSLYPMIVKEALVRGIAESELCRIVINKATDSSNFMAEIEAVRLRAKQQLKSAETPEEVKALLDGIVWPSR